jgi:hypothetical protein
MAGDFGRWSKEAQRLRVTQGVVVKTRKDFCRRTRERLRLRVRRALRMGGEARCKTLPMNAVK